MIIKAKRNNELSEGIKFIINTGGKVCSDTRDCAVSYTALYFSSQKFFTFLFGVVSQAR